MSRILFIENGKNPKTNNFKALNIGKMILKIVKLKNSLMVIPLMEVSTYFKIIANQQSTIIGISEFEK